MNTKLFVQQVPIPPKIQQQIETIGSYVPPDRAPEARQRAIAVWVVSRYLNRFGYGCDYTQSSAWNPASLLLKDWSADLEIFEGDRCLGVVECIPFNANDKTLKIPEPAAMPDRIAYIAVETDAENKWGAIAGFTPALEVEFPELSIPREKLLSVDRLLDLLERTDSFLSTELEAEIEQHLKTDLEAIRSQLEKIFQQETGSEKRTEAVYEFFTNCAGLQYSLSEKSVSLRKDEERRLSEEEIEALKDTLFDLAEKVVQEFNENQGED